MRAAVIKQHGPADSIVFENRPIPVPPDNGYLIKVKACGLNHLDVWVRRGVEGHKFPLPIVPGSDIAGTIEKSGIAAKKFKPGDRVLINPGLHCGACPSCHSGKQNLCLSWGLLGETTDGGCQEYIAVAENQVHLLPPQISFEHAACIPIAYVTAWQMLVEKARIKPGETILIHGAGSGVSVACLQIAKLHGMQVFMTSSSDEKLARAKVLGAHRFINTTKEPFRDAIKNLTSKQGVDVVVDHVGEPTFMESIKSLKRGGRLVSCGATAGSQLHIDWKHVFFKNIALLGSTYGTNGDFCSVLKMFEAGKLSPALEAAMKIDELPKAHAMLENRKVFGKIVVTFT